MKDLTIWARSQQREQPTSNPNVAAPMQSLSYQSQMSLQKSLGNITYSSGVVTFDLDQWHKVQ